jgi:hypothetical protein
MILQSLSATENIIINIQVRIMYMHKNKKIIICKYNLKNKCHFGENVNFDT